jgi:hypothetical protein
MSENLVYVFVSNILVIYMPSKFSPLSTENGTSSWKVTCYTLPCSFYYDHNSLFQLLINSMSASLFISLRNLIYIILQTSKTFFVLLFKKCSDINILHYIES